MRSCIQNKADVPRSSTETYSQAGFYSGLAYATRFHEDWEGRELFRLPNVDLATVQ
jgi:hypothetical protein